MKIRTVSKRIEENIGIDAKMEMRCVLVDYNRSKMKANFYGRLEDFFNDVMY